MDVRDGNEGIVNPDNGRFHRTTGILLSEEVDEFVRIFARAFNEGYIDSNGDKGFDPDEFGTGHAAGYGYNSTDNGIRFFTMTGDGRLPLSSSDFLGGATDPADIYDIYENITAKNFTVASDILDDYNLIAASDASGQAGNIEVLNKLLSLRRDTDMFSEGAPEDFMKSLVATLGIDAQQSGNYKDNQQIVVNQIINRRLSDSGVSIDEEMTNLVKFQHAYNAAAKMIQTMSEIYETLINGLFV